MELGIYSISYNSSREFYLTSDVEKARQDFLRNHDLEENQLISKGVIAFCGSIEIEEGTLEAIIAGANGNLALRIPKDVIIKK